MKNTCNLDELCMLVLRFEPHEAVVLLRKDMVQLGSERGSLVLGCYITCGIVVVNRRLVEECGSWSNEVPEETEVITPLSNDLYESSGFLVNVTSVLTLSLSITCIFEGQICILGSELRDLC